MAEFDWSFPYTSQRMPVFASNAVATSQPLAAAAGLEMLRKGGNAIDAAIATAAALTVVEPTSNGLGSDGFAIVWAGGGLHGFNGSGRSPKRLPVEHFEGAERVPFFGWDGVTVPGAVGLWATLSDRFGSLPFEDLMQPAVHYASDGYLVSPQTAYYWGRSFDRYTEFKPWNETFASKGRAPKVGEHVMLPDHAATLESIGATKAEAFYRGQLAEKMAAHAAETGGWLATDDLAEHHTEEVRPIEVDYRGVSLHEIPPNGQGIIALLALGMLSGRDLSSMAVDSADWLHVQIEAMKLAFADGRRSIADPKWMDIETDALLDADYLAERAKLIDMKQAGDPGHGKPMMGGTVYLTAADADGMMVSYIQSNYTGFGSGVVVPGTGIALQNRGACFSTEAGHPNVVEPGKRPYHTIIPGFVTHGGEPLMSFGVMGGFMQPQGHAQVMVRMFDHGQNAQAALDAPRWQVMEGRRVLFEPGFDPAVLDDLKQRGHEIELAEARTVTHGRGQIIHRMNGAYCAASDLRSDGLAIGY